MTAQLIQMRQQPDPDALRAAFHDALAALLAAYASIVELGDPAAVFQLAAEVLIGHRERSAAAGDVSGLNLMRAMGRLTATAAELELDLAATMRTAGREGELNAHEAETAHLDDMLRMRIFRAIEKSSGGAGHHGGRRAGAGRVDRATEAP